MKKFQTLIVTTAALLLSACGPATYDIENPEESSAAMLKDLSQDEKVKFGTAVQKITFKRLEEENLSLMDLVKISKDPEKMKELLRCLDGKSVEEIIEMAK